MSKEIHALAKYMDLSEEQKEAFKDVIKVLKEKNEK